METIKLTDKRFKSFTIPKSNGTKRTIYYPNESLMAENKALARSIGYEFEPHKSATGFRHKYDVIRNALIHRRNGYFFMFDIKSFFESITYATVGNKMGVLYARKTTFEYLDVDKKTKTLRLVQGAPTSPIVSNIIMKDFDRTITKRVNTLNYTYTRYADDITISCKEDSLIENDPNKTLETMRNFVIYALKKYVAFSKLELNETKTRWEKLESDKPVKVVGIFINKETHQHKNNWLSTGKKYNENLVKMARDIAEDLYKSKYRKEDVNTKSIEVFLGKFNWFLQVNRQTKPRTKKVIDVIIKIFNEENIKKTKSFLQNYIN